MTVYSNNCSLLEIQNHMAMRPCVHVTSKKWFEGHNKIRAEIFKIAEIILNQCITILE